MGLRLLLVRGRNAGMPLFAVRNTAAWVRHANDRGIPASPMTVTGTQPCY